MSTWEEEVKNHQFVSVKMQQSGGKGVKICQFCGDLVIGRPIKMIYSEKVKKYDKI